MNIFLCCLQNGRSDPSGPESFWRENFKPSLEAMGHRVFEPEAIDFVTPLTYYHDKRWIARQRALTSEALVRQVKHVHAREGVDLFFSYFYSVHVFPEAVSEIGSFAIPTVNFFCDNLRQFHSVSALAKWYTLNWVPEKEACAFYRRLGAPHLHLPMAANPTYYEARHDREIPQVTFIGHADGLRTRLLAEVFASDLPLRIYGGGWRKESPSAPPPGRLARLLRRVHRSSQQHSDRLRFYGLRAELRHLVTRGSLGLELLKGFEDALHPSVSHSEMLDLGANSAVFLGINRCPHPSYPLDAPLVYSRLRDIEAPMMGACYLTEYCAELDDLYEVGKEIAVYRTSEELITECRRLLGDEAARGELRQRGRQAALARHTWQHRFEALFHALGLRAYAASEQRR